MRSGLSDRPDFLFSEQTFSSWLISREPTISKSNFLTILSILQTAVYEFKKAKAIPKGLSESLSITKTPDPESPFLKNGPSSDYCIA